MTQITNALNNAQTIVFSLKGQSITFKPVEKGKDRPVQTMTFVDFQIGQYGLEVETRISYKTKVATTETTVTRLLSIARVMEYIAQAAQQTHVDDQPGTSVETTPEVVEIPVAEVAQVEEKKTKKQK